MKKNVLFACLVFIASSVLANNSPIIKYKNNEASYSIKWNDQFAQINNLVPEIEINDKWVSASEFKSIKWLKKEGTRLSEVNTYTGKVEYLYLICEGHPLISNFTVEFELMEGRPYLVMNASLKATKNIRNKQEILTSYGSNYRIQDNYTTKYRRP
jgi:hypothetical protein